jgi:hypothetical protein
MGSCSDACPIHDARQDRPGIVALRLKNFDHPRKRADWHGAALELQVRVFTRCDRQIKIVTEG